MIACGLPGNNLRKLSFSLVSSSNNIYSSIEQDYLHHVYSIT